MDDQEPSVPQSNAPRPPGPVIRRLSDRQVRQMLDPDAGNSSSEWKWEPPSLDRLRKSLSHYEISHLIACGGMAAVYKGIQKSLHRPVAIKVLPPEIGDTEMDFPSRFKIEAEAMAGFNHPNIVPVYDGGETEDGLLFFVMEYVDGTHLGRLLAEQGRMEPARATYIAEEVCKALAYAHDAGIIHRDIKPSNILIDAQGRVKVADFGLAKFPGAEPTPETGSDVAIGTPDFVAPEALDPEATPDQRADLYAVGVMLYQMLTGRIPRGRFPPPSTVIPGLDPRLDAIVDRALQPDPERRFSTASNLRKELRKVSHPKPARSVRPSPQEKGGLDLKRPARSRSLLLILLTIPAAVGLAGLGWKWSQPGVIENGVPNPPAIGEGPKGRAGMEGANIRNFVSTETSFAVGEWVRLFNGPEDLPHGLLEAGTGLKWEDGWLSATGKALQWQIQRIGLGQNHGIRATFREYSLQKLSRLRVRHRDRRMYDLTEMEPRLRFSDQTNEANKITEWLVQDFWPRPVPGSQFTIELIVIESVLSARINGVLAEVRDDRLTEGGPSFLINNQSIRDIEVINLDGLSETEARLAAGLPEISALPASQ